MIYGVTNSDRFIYHYTKPKTGLLIIKKLQLRLAPYAETNDPKENKDWLFWLTGAVETDLLQTSVNEVSTRFSRALKQLVRVVCFCADSEPLTGDPIRDISNRGLAKPRMWQQYGEGHSGVCFVLDRERFTRQIMSQVARPCAIYGGKVTYVDRYCVNDLDRGEFGIDVTYLNRVGLESYVKHHAHVFREPLFFEKMTDWQQEKEFRWIILSHSEEDIFVDISESLVGVVFGEKTERIEPMLNSLSSNVQTIRLKWVNGCPWYDFSDVRCDHGLRLRQGRRLK